MSSSFSASANFPRASRKRLRQVCSSFLSVLPVSDVASAFASACEPFLAPSPAVESAGAEVESAEAGCEVAVEAAPAAVPLLTSSFVYTFLGFGDSFFCWRALRAAAATPSSLACGDESCCCRAITAMPAKPSSGKASRTYTPVLCQVNAAIPTYLPSRDPQHSPRRRLGLHDVLPQFYRFRAAAPLG